MMHWCYVPPDFFFKCGLDARLHLDSYKMWCRMLIQVNPPRIPGPKVEDAFLLSSLEMQADTHSLDWFPQRWDEASTTTKKKMNKQSSQSAKEKIPILSALNFWHETIIPHSYNKFTLRGQETTLQQSDPPWHASNWHLWNPRQLAKVSTTPSPWLRTEVGELTKRKGEAFLFSPHLEKKMYM